MAGSGVFPKVDGDIYYSHDANKSYANSFISFINSTANIMKILPNTSTSNDTNLRYADLTGKDYIIDGFNIPDYCDSGATTVFIENRERSKYSGRRAWGAKVYDKFYTGSLGTKWRSGGAAITFSNGAMSIPGNGAAGDSFVFNSGVDGVNFKTFSGAEIILHWTANNGPNGESCSIQISDGGSHVSIKDVAGASTTAAETWRIILDKNAGSAYAFSDENYSTTPSNAVSIANFGSYYIRFRAGGTGGGNASVGVYSIAYLDGLGGSSILRTITKNFGNNRTNGLVYYDGNASGITNQISSNNGTNYTNVVNGDSVQIGNPGSIGVMQLVWNLPTYISGGSILTMQSINSIGGYFGQ